MPCSICKELGHNFKTCLKITDEERQKIIDERKKKKEEAKKKREEAQKRKEDFERNTIKLQVKNPNEYYIGVYWGFKFTFGESVTDHIMFLTQVGPFGSREISFQRDKHRVVAFPLDEVKPNQNNPGHRFVLPGGIAYRDIYDAYGTDRIKLFDQNMEEYDGSLTELNIPKVDYSPKKSELEQWKEFGLKSHFILKEIEKFTTKDGEHGYKVVHEKYDTIGEFVEMIQDIKEPENVSEIDREMSGVPSRLTNIT